MSAPRLVGCTVVITSLLVAVGSTAHAQSFAWARSGGGVDLDEAKAVAVDADGNSYVTGIFSRSLACFVCGQPAIFGAGQPNATTLLPDGGTQDIFVAKYDPAGVLQWARRAGGGGPDEALGIAVDGAGNSYITGLTGAADFGDGVTLPDSGAFVAKYDSAGHALWARTLDPAGIGFAIAVDPAGVTYVTGYAPDPIVGGSVVTLWKVSAGGTQEWNRQATGNYMGGGSSIAVDGNGNSHVTGSMAGGTALFGAGGPIQIPLTDTSGGGQMFVAKYDSSGNLIWARQSADQVGLAYGTGIALDAAGNSYVGGFATTTILGLGESNETPIAGDNFVAKYNPLGQLSWARSIAGRPVEVKDVATAPGGGVFITGGGGVVTFAPGEGNETTLPAGVGGDLFVARYNANGAFEWARRAGPGTGGAAIAADGSSNAIVVGAYVGVSTFGAGEPTETTLTNANVSPSGYFDLFVAKYLNDEVTRNRAPVADPQAVIVSEDTPTGIVLTGSDPDGDPLSFSIVTLPAHGTLSGTPPNLTYAPHANYYGTDSFTFRVFDGQDFSNTATVTITITPVNDAPVAHDQVLSTPRNTPLALILTADDVDGDPLGFTVVGGPAHGTLAGAGADRTYTPNAGYTGPDSFTFTASDNVAVSAPATVAITVVSTDLVCGSLTSGTIAGPGQIDQYLFAGAAGQLISMALGSTGGFATNTGSLSATMTLVAPSGAVVGTLRSNSLNNFRLPESGTYVVRVRATNNSTVGSYNLNFECLYPEQSPDTVALGCGALASGAIEARAEVDLYSFTGSSGQSITLTLASAGGFATNTGSLSATATLFAPSGALVGSVRSNSQANFVLPATGTYVVRVHATNLATTGSYNLNFECLYPEQSPGTLALGCGALASGTIAASGQVDLYSFAASAGQLISLTLASTGGFATNTGSLSATATLFAPSGAPSGSVRTNSQANFVVPAAGTYVVRVHATNLATLGSYNLNFECLYPVQSPGEELPCGALASGTIEARGEVDLFSFAGSTGQLIALTLASTAGFAANTGSLSATATLFAPSGAPVGSIRTNSQANFVLPATGTYVVRVHATNLGTTGSYNVNLECLYPEQSPGTAELACGALASGALEGRGEVDLYSFLGSTGELVSFTLASTGGFATNTGSLSATLAVFAPSGAILGSVRTNSQARWVLPETGKYVARVHATNLATLGSYNLNLECLSPTLSPDAGVLTCGASAAANVAASGEVDLYSFDSTAGQPVSLTLISTGGFATNTGSNSVALTLLSPSGAVIGTLRSNSTGSFVLPETGLYVIGINATSLARTGSYVVTLSCAPN